MFYLNHPDLPENIAKEKRFWKTMSILYYGSYLYVQSNKKTNLITRMINDTDVDIVGQSNLQPDVEKKWGRSAQFRCYLPSCQSENSALRHIAAMRFGYTDRHRLEIEEIKYTGLSYSPTNCSWYFTVSSYDLMVKTWEMGFRPGIVKENSPNVEFPEKYIDQWEMGKNIINFCNFRIKPEPFMFGRKKVLDD